MALLSMKTTTGVTNQAVFRLVQQSSCIIKKLTKDESYATHRHYATVNLYNEIF